MDEKNKKVLVRKRSHTILGVRVRRQTAYTYSKPCNVEILEKVRRGRIHSVDDYKNAELLENAMKFMEYLMTDCSLVGGINNNAVIFDYANISKNIIMDIFNTRYYKLLIDILIKGRIIECDQKYVAKNYRGLNEKCLGYRVHPRFQSSYANVYKLCSDPVSEKRLATVTNPVYTDVRSNGYTDQTDLLARLSIDMATVDEYVNNITIKKAHIQFKDFKAYKDGLVVCGIVSEEEDKILRYNRTGVSFISKPKLKLLVDKFGFKIIQLSKKYYLHKEERDYAQFEEHLTRQLKSSYMLSITNLIYNKKIYANVNHTNNRLDTNLTSIPSFFRTIFVLDGEFLVNIDICNSQLAFLGNILNGNLEDIVSKYSDFDFSEYYGFDDVKRFYELTSTGVFYEEMADNMYEGFYSMTTKEQKSTRGLIKTLTFMVMFSKPQSYERNSDEMFIRFKEMFPNVVKCIDAFQNYTHDKINIGSYEKAVLLSKKTGKKILPIERAKGSLSIMLASVESYVMIGTLHGEQLKGKRVLFLHDAVYFPYSDTKEVYYEVIECFKKHNFVCALTYNDKKIDDEIIDVINNTQPPKKIRFKTHNNNNNNNKVDCSADDVKEQEEHIKTYTVLKIIYKNHHKSYKKAHKALVAVVDLDDFMQQSKKHRMKTLGMTNIATTENFLNKFLEYK